jgi:hypothetical protein
MGSHESTQNPRYTGVLEAKPQKTHTRLGTQMGTQDIGGCVEKSEIKTEESTQAATQSGTQKNGFSYPPGIDLLGTQLGTQLTARPLKRDTRVQLNLKISVEKLCQLKDFCESTGHSQKEAIEEAIALLCGRVNELGTQNKVDSEGRLSSQIDKRDRSIDQSIVEFYKAETGNEWTPADQNALDQLPAQVKIEYISAGIVKSLIGSSGPIRTFTYCAKTALQLATSPDVHDPKQFLMRIWRMYDRNKETIRRKQRGV